MHDSFEVKFTYQARRQISEIVDYISNELFSTEAAGNFINLIEEKVNNLSEFPELYRLVDEEPWRTRGIRKVIVNNFIMYYWIDNENYKIQITAVIYGQRNQLEQLKQMLI